MVREQPTLHEAMQRILRDNGRQMSIEQIAAENRRRDLFQKPTDHEYPSPSQIAMRAKNYPEIFEVIVRLRE